MKTDYYRNANGNYLVLDEIAPEAENEFERRMIEKNHPAHLMEMKPFRMNNVTQMHYKISGMQSLEKRFERLGIKYEELKELLSEISKMLGECDRYLISAEHISFAPDMIYSNYVDGRCRFAYVPELKGTFAEAFRHLMEFVLQHLEHEDQQAVELAYTLFQESQQEEFSFMEWEKSHIAAPQVKVQTQIQRDSCGESFSFEEPEEVQEVYEEAWEALPDLPAEEEEEEIPESFFKYLWQQLRRKKRKKQPKTDKERKAKKEKKAKKQKERCDRKKVALLEESFEAASERVQGHKDLSAVFMNPGFEQTDAFETVCMPCENIVWQKFYPAGVNGGEEIEVLSECITIGKNPELCEAVIDNPSVSRVHARALRMAGEVYLEDANSTNGTMVDGHVLNPGERMKLRQGARVCFGAAEYVFR